jgi:hypothetical protein
MKWCLFFISAAMLLLASSRIFAQQAASESSAGVAFWVVYWGRPEAIMFGPEQEDFNKENA